MADINYYKKYLKYKEKYKLLGGNSIKIKTNTNNFVDKTYLYGVNNSLKIKPENVKNTNQTFLMKEYNGKTFFADENKNCISDNGQNTNASLLSMKTCDISNPDQQFSIHKNIAEDKYVFENKNKGKCLDHLYNQKLYYSGCNANPTQQFTISKSEQKIDDIDLTNYDANVNLQVREITQQDITDNYKKASHSSFTKGLNESSMDVIYRKALNPDNNNILLINFAGFNAAFTTLYTTALSPTHIMAFRDKINNWYYDKLPKIVDYINKFIIEKNIKKIILWGISMGGYAALYCSNFIDNCICIAMNPQTFPKTRDHPYYIYSEEIYFSRSNLYDLRKVFTCKRNNSKKYIISSKNECNTPDTCKAPYLHDLVYTSYLLGLPNVVIVFLSTIGHNIFPLIELDSFLMLIINEYDKLITDMNIGKKILLGIKLKPVAPVAPVK